MNAGRNLSCLFLFCGRILQIWQCRGDCHGQRTSGCRHTNVMTCVIIQADMSLKELA